MNLFNSIKKGINSFYVPQEEDFHKYGLISPSHFERAGDQLASTGWKWNVQILFLACHKWKIIQSIERFEKTVFINSGGQQHENKR